MLRHLGPASVIFIGVIISALGALWAARQQAKSAEALRNKSDEIAALNREIAQSIIGGDSFCYLSVSPL
jgi:gas vesicle protein